MEVHHHPEVGKKNFKEYLLEGLMIFVAVTLGFFAESLREHINERSKEGDYIVSLAQDLRADTAAINYAVRLENWRLAQTDTLMDMMLHPPTDPSEIRRAYELVNATTDQEDVHFSNRTYEELKSSGDMRLIQSVAVTNAIQRYVKGVLDCQDQDGYYGHQVDVMGEACARIFLARFRFRPAEKDAFRFGNLDPAGLNEYCNRLGFYQGVVDSYAKMIRNQKKDAVALLALLQKEYDLQ